MKSIRKPLAVFICLTVVMAAAMGLAALYQTDFGTVDVSVWYLETDGGDVCAYKLYVPQSAAADTPAPAVLLFHGYQNDKDTSSTYALELARRGIVAMCFDSYGHGDTTVGMRTRGYATRKLPGWDKEISGPERFLVMMSFSTNDFFTLEGVRGKQPRFLHGRAAGASGAARDAVCGRRKHRLYGALHGHVVFVERRGGLPRAQGDCPAVRRAVPAELLRQWHGHLQQRAAAAGQVR